MVCVCVCLGPCDLCVCVYICDPVIFFSPRYFWLCWVFIAADKLSLVGANGLVSRTQTSVVVGTCA